MAVAKNARCPCGSGTKYKKCCLPKDRAAGRVTEEMSSGWVPGIGILPRGARVAEHDGERMIVSEGVDQKAIEFAARYYRERDARGGSGNAIQSFLQPLIDQTDGSPEQVEKAISLGMLFWNMALTPDDIDLTQELRQTLVEVGIADPDEQKEFFALARREVERHRRLFPEMHRRRGDAT